MTDLKCAFMYQLSWFYLVPPILASISQVPIVNVCDVLADIISPASSVHFPGQNQYERDIHHWTPSVSQTSLCSVEPGSAVDVGRIIRLLGSTRTPFAIKSGGHAVNPGFSSTPGVHIALSRLNNVSYNSKDKTVTVGSGSIWDDVYANLTPYNISLVGSRAPGLGVGGFTLGGGYSYVTNQYGLSMDTVVGYHLVKPDGRIVFVTEASDPELFFGLKGGFNNFGIVTHFTFRSFPQSVIWGGTINYSPTHIDEVLDAVALFSVESADPKANLAALAVGTSGQSQISVLLFYDAPQPPHGSFDLFLRIPSVSRDIGTRSMLSLLKYFTGFNGFRVTSNGIPTSFYSKNMLQTIWNETVYWGGKLPASANPLVSYAIEPFLSVAFTRAISPSACLGAKARSQHPNPTGIVFAFTGDTAEFDTIFRAAVRQSAAHLKKVAESSGQAIDAVTYPNYAIFDTPLVDLYGENLPRLKSLKRRVDPLNVMGLAGGWKF